MFIKCNTSRKNSRVVQFISICSKEGILVYNLRVVFTCELNNENMNAKGCVPKEWLCVDGASGLSSDSKLKLNFSELFFETYGVLGANEI